MRYVKIRAKNYNEAMMQLKIDHGDDAIPISHKNVKDGGLLNTSLFARDIVELTAAIPERKTVPRVKPAQKTGFDITVGGENQQAPEQKESQGQSSARTAVDTGNSEILNSSIARKAAQVVVDAEKEKEQVAESAREDPANSRAFEKLEKEFHELKGMLNDLLEQKD